MMDRSTGGFANSCCNSFRSLLSLLHRPILFILYSSFATLLHPLVYTRLIPSRPLDTFAISRTTRCRFGFGFGFIHLIFSLLC